MRSSVKYLFLILLIGILLAGCAVSEGAAPVVEDNASVMEEAESENSVLLVGEMGYTMSQLEGMKTLEVEYIGKDDQVTLYTGVLVLDLLADAGLEGETVVFSANDGYEVELTLSELEGCADCVVAFDEQDLRLVLPGFPGNVQVKGLVELSVK